MIKINRLLVSICISISGVLYGSAEPQVPPLNEMPANILTQIGEDLPRKDLGHLATAAKRFSQIYHDRLRQLKTETKLLRYWKKPVNCIFIEDYVCFLGDHANPIAFSPDGDLLAYGTPASIEIVNLKTNSKLFDKFLGFPCDHLSFSKPDSAHLRFVDAELNHICTWHVTKNVDSEKCTLTPVDDFRIESIPSLVTFSADGTQKAAAYRSLVVRTWDKDGNKKEKRISGTAPAKLEIDALRLSTNYKLLAIGDSEGKVTVWNLDTNETTIMPIDAAHVAGRNTMVSSIDICPHGKFLAASFYSRHAHCGLMIWNLETQAIYFKDTSEAIYGAAFSPDGRILAYGKADGIVLLDVESREIINTIACEFPRSVQFSPDGKCIASGLWDKHQSLKLWRAGKHAESYPKPCNLDDLLKESHDFLDTLNDISSRIQNLPCMQHQNPT